MPRPEKPITTENKALRDLAQWLRDIRSRSGQGYRTLALNIDSGCHATTLQRAASGATMPKLRTVLDYARGCDAPAEEARRLWSAARYERTRMSRDVRKKPAPRPEYVRDYADISAAMGEMYEKAGSPPLRTLEQRAGGYGELPHSTAHRIIMKQAVPRNEQQFMAFLKSCDVPEKEWPAWRAAWNRVWQREKYVDPFLQLASEYPGMVVTVDNGRGLRRKAETDTVPEQGSQNELRLWTDRDFRRAKADRKNPWRAHFENVWRDHAVNPLMLCETKAG